MEVGDLFTVFMVIETFRVCFMKVLGTARIHGLCSCEMACSCLPD